jgi:hypothetical protein
MELQCPAIDRDFLWGPCRASAGAASPGRPRTRKEAAGCSLGSWGTAAAGGWFPAVERGVALMPGLREHGADHPARFIATRP